MRANQNVEVVDTVAGHVAVVSPFSVVYAVTGDAPAASVEMLTVTGSGVVVPGNVGGTTMMEQGVIGTVQPSSRRTPSAQR